MQFNTSYLNLTPNKTPRNTIYFKPEFVVMHETAGYGSLQWNLRADVRSSYNYLISRNGTVYHYVNERAFISWHAGVNSRARGYSGGQINVFGIGVELEGPNDGTAITTKQLTSMLELLRYFNAVYGIPLAKDYFIAHKDVAPGYKTDPQGYSVAHTLSLLTPPPAVPADLDVIGVRPSCTLPQFKASLTRHKANLSSTEMDRVYTIASWLEIDPCFLIGLWKAESGSPLGGSELQQQTQMPINVKTYKWPGRDSVTYKKAEWKQYQSFQLGWFEALVHLKQVHGAHGRTKLSEIIPVHAPKEDGNNPEQIIKSIIEDMLYIRASRV